MRFHSFVFLPERMRTACDRSGSNGKERDALRLNPQSGGLRGARLTSPQDLLTGYGYLPRQARQAHHGARYMDHELVTMWLSVEPMAPSWPPFPTPKNNFCHSKKHSYLCIPKRIKKNKRK